MSDYTIVKNQEEMVNTLNSMAGSYKKFGIAKYADNRYADIETKTSVRAGFRPVDYESFRPEEATPQDTKKAIAACMNAYYSDGLIRNIIDLMADFACQGIEIIHPDATTQAFYQNWWKKINGTDRSERFLNLFYRAGTVPIYRYNAKLRTSDVKKLRMSFSEVDMEYPRDERVPRNEIPIKYVILNPLSLEVLSNQLEMFSGKLNYGLRLHTNLTSKLLAPNIPTDSQIVNKLPAFIRKHIDKNNLHHSNLVIPLDREKLEIFFYKKDDWQVWPIPFLFSILKDINILTKLKLADLAALDGAISQVRLWRLGDLEHGIFPGPEAMNTLNEILLNNAGGGPMDIIWGPELDFKESSSELYKWLGSEKYGPTLNAIYAGVGIPPTLTGSATESGFTNNYISLKTLIERLNYGRDALYQFWNKELTLVQKAMGFRKPAQLRFAHMNLSDENSEKKLFMDLVDRGYLSVDTLLNRFGEIPEVEQMRIRSEDKKRQSGKMIRRAGPWFEPHFDEQLKKIALQQKLITPEQLVELTSLLPPTEGKEPIAEMVARRVSERNMADDKLSGIPGQGRPLGSKDKQKRKQKEVMPRSNSAEFISVSVWAKDVYRDITDIINPILLESIGKKNVRSLSTQEFNAAENIKFSILCQLEPYEEINEDKIKTFINSDLRIDPEISSTYTSLLNKFRSSVNRELTVDDTRQIQVAVYALFNA